MGFNTVCVFSSPCLDYWFILTGERNEAGLNEFGLEQTLSVRQILFPHRMLAGATFPKRRRGGAPSPN